MPPLASWQELDSLGEALAKLESSAPLPLPSWSRGSSAEARPLTDWLVSAYLCVCLGSVSPAQQVTLAWASYLSC